VKEEPLIITKALTGKDGKNLDDDDTRRAKSTMKGIPSRALTDRELIRPQTEDIS